MARVRYLLETHDWVYDAELSRGERATTGFADPEVRRMRCGNCAGVGCEKCHRGRVEVIVRDPYDSGEKGFWAGPEPKTMSDQEIERSLASLREDELKRNGVYAQHVDFEGALRRAEYRDKRGSYGVLRAALDFLPPWARGRDAVRWLAEHVPGTIHVPWEHFKTEQEALDRDIHGLKDRGYSRQEIADFLEIHPSRVRAAIKRGKNG